MYSLRGLLEKSAAAANHPRLFHIMQSRHTPYPSRGTRGTIFCVFVHRKDIDMITYCQDQRRGFSVSAIMMASFCRHVRMYIPTHVDVGTRCWISTILTVSGDCELLQDDLHGAGQRLVELPSLSPDHYYHFLFHFVFSLFNIRVGRRGLRGEI